MHLSRFNGFHKQHKLSCTRYSACAIKLISALRIKKIPMHPGQLQWMADDFEFLWRLAVVRPLNIRPDLFPPHVTEGDQYFVAGSVYIITTTVVLIRRYSNKRLWPTGYPNTVGTKPKNCPRASIVSTWIQYTSARITKMMSGCMHQYHIRYSLVRCNVLPIRKMSRLFTTPKSPNMDPLRLRLEVRHTEKIAL